jgi:hypothetical protein
MKVKKHLNFSTLVSSFSELLTKLPDSRRKASINYSINDTFLSGLACMYIQSPSLLSYQETLLRRCKRNNLQTQFNVKGMPKDTEMRNIIDSIPGDNLAPVFKTYLTKLQRDNILKKYRFIGNKYLVTLDGTQYFSSKTIHCDSCLTQVSKTGIKTYSHKVVQSAVINPSIKQVLPLMPEEIINTDGAVKQDCEINAAKRLLPKIKKQYPRLPLIYTGDSIYATAPFIQEVLDHGGDYIFNALRGDHKTLYENLKDPDFSRYESLRDKGRRFIHEWATDVKLNNSSDIKVNVMRLFIVTPQKDNEDKSQYIGTWITNLSVNELNIEWLVKGARSRWKIENECFNTLKNQGYEIEHNYGHGKKYLCFNFYILTLLAFYLHQILELADKLYQDTRRICRTLRQLWEYVRVFFDMKVFGSWEEMLTEICRIREGP